MISYFRPTMVAEAPCRIFHSKVRSAAMTCPPPIKQSLTIASVMDLHIPLPPPVQNKTLPLNMSSRKTLVEGGGGGAITCSLGAMVENELKLLGPGVFLCQALFTLARPSIAAKRDLTEGRRGSRKGRVFEVGSAQYRANDRASSPITHHVY